MKPNLKLVTPTIEKQTVRQPASKNPKGRKPNAELRTREHLTPAEVETLIKAVKGNRNGHRDATMILIAYRHGLEGFGALRFAMESNRLPKRGNPHSAREAWHASNAPTDRQ